MSAVAVLFFVHGQNKCRKEERKKKQRLLKKGKKQKSADGNEENESKNWIMLSHLILISNTNTQLY